MNTHCTTGPAVSAPVRQVPPLLMLMTLAIGFVMAMIDVTAVNTALSDISVSLSVPLTGLVWVVDGYTLTFAALLLPYWLLVLGTIVMNVAIGIAIPGMTATVMLVAGKAHANSAAAALNANRQIGALVGVAMMGTVLHMTVDWAWRLPSAFGLVSCAYAGALALVYFYVKPLVSRGGTRAD